jgi:hypothetical protein
MFMKALDQMGKLDDPFFGNIPPDETVKLVFNLSQDEDERGPFANAPERPLMLQAIWRRSWGRPMGGKRDERREWYRELRRNRAKALNAPSWLWRSVVDLLLEHQRGYLEHCRAVSAIA